ncbi:MAG: nucleotidyltransferase domain-containing protein [Spirochaetales bacterium]|nr:nucleotidyltransferase domain-containing protein [Spirochaetales bacterium]
MTLRQVRQILERHADTFQHAYVYGSVARGEQDEASDVDLLLVRRTRAAFFDRIREVMELVLELGAVDLLIYTPAELKELVESRRNGFLEQVVIEGVKVEGRQGRRAALAPTGRKRSGVRPHRPT